MIRQIFFASLSVILLMPLSPLCRGALAADQQIIDGIAAVVNGDVVTYSQVRELVAPRERLLHSQFSGEELANKIKEARTAALQDLIDRQLIIQNFHKEKYEIPQFVVDQEVKRVIQEGFGGDRNTFIKTLQAQNFTMGEFRKMQMDKIIVAAMRSKNAKPNTLIPPAKIDEYYAKHREEFVSKEEIKLRMIMIPGHGSDAATQKALAEEILAKLVHGSEFDRMAQMYSEDSSRDLGGDWGWIEKKTLAEPLEKVAFNLQVGKVSQIVEVGGNFYILKVDEKRGGVVTPMAQVRQAIEAKLKQEEAQRLQEHWLAGLRQKAYIKTF